MSDTPETDAKLAEGGAAHLAVLPAEFARSLERQLQEAQWDIQIVRDAANELRTELMIASRSRDAALRDAERYRSLRDEVSPFAVLQPGVSGHIAYYGAELDRRIDAALAEKGKP